MRYTLATNDRLDHLYAFHGSDFLTSLWDLDQWLRGQVKYNPEAQSEDVLDAYDIVRDKIREFMDDNGVNLDMVQ